jgi:hypothetical protein
MSEPEIDEEKFEDWLQAHHKILESGTRDPAQAWLIYASAFADGWHKALQD